ncbi:carcinoembryonic antigen-related cell adhesion molecule 1-like isoform X2 [Heterodontus francisci]|uniref:carcinoembryonic antigen-related cell adhesion molecule 1-like isoform X2 n=1 Tax=Heterodontus francisci TaxID=7792 RepID=UPI00355C7ABE
MELPVPLQLLLLLRLINAEGGMKEVFGVVGSSVLLDPEYGADLSNSDVIWMFTGSSGKPVIILDYVPNHPKAEPSEQFKSRLHFNVSSGCLMLNNLKPSDQGVYTITVNEDWKRSKDLKLIEPLSAPLIINNSTCVNTTIELTCQVSAGKARSILWWKDNEVIMNNQRYQLVQNNSTLIISKANKSDCGIYTCTVENPVSKKNNSYSLSIYEPLSAPLIINNSTCVNTTIELTCQVSAGKARSILWWKDNEVIMNNQRYQLVQNNSTLIISEANKSDCGIYTCTVENPVSKKNNSYSLSIYGLARNHHVTVAFSIAALFIAATTLVTAIAAVLFDKMPCLNEDLKTKCLQLVQKMQQFLQMSLVLSFIFLFFACLCWMQTEVCPEMFKAVTTVSELIEAANILFVEIMRQTGFPGMTVLMFLFLHLILITVMTCNRMVCDTHKIKKFLSNKDHLFRDAMILPLV